MLARWAYTSRRVPAWAALSVGLALLAAASFLYPIYWQTRSSLMGAQLLSRARVSTMAVALPSAPATLDYFLSAPSPQRAGPVAPGPQAGGCTSASQDRVTTKHPGVLEVPSLHLVAPVIQGVTDKVLNGAVGHYPATPWPGHAGVSVVLAHDVSYFAHISSLRQGDEIVWVDHCKEELFQVVGYGVTSPGSSISLPVGRPGLVLVTCWPTDALFWTTQRYYVKAVLIGERVAGGPSGTLRRARPDVAISAPPALASEGLSLGVSGVYVDKLFLDGTPSLQFSQSPLALEMSSLAVEEYAAAAKTAAAHATAWWGAIALPGVPLPAPWELGAPTDVHLVVSGSRLTGAILVAPNETVRLVVRARKLYVASVAV